MSKLIRLDRTGHTTLAEWTPGDVAGERQAQRAFREGLESGLLASAARAGEAEVVRELPLDAELVVMRRPIAGG